ncbi:other/FunK1 protein kinase [Coprinopsis cinerea AmutBmut pab1-1]|nr:other/FunK1 protein kinase [Coprinopsis cinerea AmutBmut pab1-1]
MNEDARRKFAYGITVENDYASLWHFHPSSPVKSTAFSILQHPDLLALVSLFLATSEQLGYDPHVTLLPDMSYVYQIPADPRSDVPLYFKTVDLISQYRSSSLTGRCSRVWTVKQVISMTDRRRVAGTQLRVLKDVTLDAHRKTEAEIQDELFRDIAAFANHGKWRTSPIVKRFKEPDFDSLAEALEGDNFKRFFSGIIARHLDSDSVTLPTRSSGHIPPPNGPEVVRNPVSKRRCFFVYEHVCTSLYDIPTMGEAIDVAKGCLTALRLMSCAGWVHRDISPGNIRSSSDHTWQVKLSDLEFAKRFPDSPDHVTEQMTGTPAFMPCEVQSSGLIMPQAEYRDRELDEDDDDGEMGDVEQVEDEDEEPIPIIPPVPVVYN